MKLKYCCLFIGVLLLLSGCKDELFSEYNQEKEDLVYLPLSCRIAKEVSGNSDVSSRATNGSDAQKVNNIWLFEFDGTDNSSLLLTNPQYIEITNENISAGVIPSDSPVRLLFIANTNLSTINWKATKGVTTYEDILKISDDYYREEEASGLENDNVVMCGTMDGTIHLGSQLDPELYRSISKIELNLTVSADCKYEVISARLCNVPSKIYWADYLRYEQSENEITPSPLVSKFRAYSDAEPDKLSAGNTRTYTWYMPRNARGVFKNDQGDQKSKNQLAPGNATYIEIYAIDTSPDSNGGGRYYRIFPGADLTTDFNILPNRRYNLSFTITNKTVGEDSRIVGVEDVIFTEAANCYILNPPIGGKAISYTIPALEQANKFFDRSTGGYTDIIKSTDSFGGFKTIDQTWTCKVIWCDNPDMIAFGHYTEESADKLYMPVYSGNGAGNKVIKVVVPPLTQSQHGSLCIGLFDTSGTCRWSWLLWVTDYNPDIPIIIDPLKFTYSVPGGQVDRYASGYFGYRTPTSGETTLTPLYNKVYDSSANNEKYFYNRSYMMDRNLGARAAYGVSAECGGHLYQYGRKDPFQPRWTLYDGDGNDTKLFTKTNGGGMWNKTEVANKDGKYTILMSDAIANPTTLILGTSTSTPWLGTTSENTTFFEGTINTPYYVWQDPTLIAQPASGVNTRPWNKVRKSLFDPCPPGWQIPTSQSSAPNIVDDFTIARTTPSSNINGFYNERGLYYHDSYGIGCYYWPEIKKDSNTPAPVDGIIFYPAAGFFSGKTFQNDATESSSSYGRWWLNMRTSAATNGRAYIFNIYHDIQPNCKINENMYRSYGCSVRCIKSPVIPAGQ